MDNWDDLRFVVALARYGSMANAARHLRTNTATVSRRIKRLNETTQTTLFHKGASEWELTADGRRLYDMAERFGEDLRGFQAAFDQDGTALQTVRVTGLEFLNDVILAKSLQKFREDHPNIVLELNATDRNISLAFGEADIALRLSRPIEGRLIARRIANIEIAPYGPKEVKTKDWIGLPIELDWTPEMKNALAFYGREPSFRLSSFSSILIAMAETGLSGIAPEFMARNYPQFEQLQTHDDIPVRELWMLVHETRKNESALRNTCKWIEQAFSAAMST